MFSLEWISSDSRSTVDDGSYTGESLVAALIYTSLCVVCLVLYLKPTVKTNQYLCFTAGKPWKLSLTVPTTNEFSFYLMSLRYLSL